MRDKLLCGIENRAVGATAMNQDSSRSNSLFYIIIEANEMTQGQSHVTVGKLNLVDSAERQFSIGVRFTEAIDMNYSIITFTQSYNALADHKSQLIPYRDSKLTRLLKDSLGGNAKTVMIANIGPADYNYDETTITLKYAHKAKQIKNVPKINEDPKDAQIRKFYQEILKLKQQLKEVEEV